MNSRLCRMSFFCFAVSTFWGMTLFSAQAGPADLASLEKSLQTLQAELKTYQEKTDIQARQIDTQGKEIAHLKNQLGNLPDKTGIPYIPSKDENTFKQQVRDVLQEFRLSERQETPEEKRLETVYDDGFYLKGKDDTLRIGGWYQGDVNVYDRGNEGDDRFRNRAVRLDIRGVLEDYFEYRLYTQFAGTSANLQEAWLMYKYFPFARIKFGQVLVPFSLESQYSARWIDFVEKSIGVSNLQPAEDVGLMVFGNPLGGRIEYGAGIFNGRARTLEDNNDAFDLGGRLVLAPFIGSKNNLLKDFYVGGSIITGRSEETLATTGFTTAGGNKFFTYAANTRHADDRTKFGSELQWIYGPGDIKAEYVAARFKDVDRLDLKRDVNLDSWYVSGTYILTGERKVRNKPINPKHVFSLKDGGWGAWEVGLRFEQFFVNEAPLALGLATGTDEVNAYTFGLNWWPNKHIRIMADYTFNKFSDAVQIGNESQDSEHLFLGRIQYDF